MKKILITGMSASHASLNANRRSLSFAGLVYDVLVESGHEVVMCDPRVSWSLEDVEEYSAVIVGVSPITSLSANKAYGALNLISLLWEDPRLRLLVDAPHPAQIGASLRSVHTNPANLTKPFYAYRQGYQLAASESVSRRLLGTVDRLLNDTWPETIYPSLPWRDAQHVAKELPAGALNSLRGINLDSFLVAESAPKGDVEKIEKWSADAPSSTWTKKVKNTLALPISPMKHTKGQDDMQVGSQILRSAGSLVSPHRDGTWWTYRYIQSLNHGVPVATDWKESQHIGKSWSVLAATIEHMSNVERRDLAWDQLQDYMSAIPRRENVRKTLEDLVGLHSKIGKEAYAV
jgi:hypothetical protein